MPALPQLALRTESRIFGPLRSRRLGISLGVDVIPKKICSLDCVYCEAGHTTLYALTPEPYFSVEGVAADVAAALADRPDIDWITFSGSGEPTLNSLLGEMIRKLKKQTSVPVAVITNGTLLWLESVRRALSAADAVLPSLDAATPRAFERINQPHPMLDVESVIRGLTLFREEYGGALWLEVLIVAGINDSDEEAARLRSVIDEIRPDRIHLNTVVRPPADVWARPVGALRMKEICAILGDRCEIISGPARERGSSARTADEAAVLRLLARRPMKAGELCDALDSEIGAINAILRNLAEAGAVERRPFQDEAYFTLGSSK